MWLVSIAEIAMHGSPVTHDAITTKSRLDRVLTTPFDAQAQGQSLIGQRTAIVQQLQPHLDTAREQQLGERAVVVDHDLQLFAGRVRP